MRIEILETIQMQCFRLLFQDALQLEDFPYLIEAPIAQFPFGGLDVEETVLPELAYRVRIHLLVAIEHEESSLFFFFQDVLPDGFAMHYFYTVTRNICKQLLNLLWVQDLFLSLLMEHYIQLICVHMLLVRSQNRLTSLTNIYFYLPRRNCYFWIGVFLLSRPLRNVVFPMCNHLTKRTAFAPFY